MEKEYKTEEVRAVWEALVKAFGEKQAGCTAQDIAAATGLSEEVARACLEYLRQTGKVERAGELYVPEAKAAGAGGDVGMTARRYRTRSPEAMPEREMRFGGQGADQWSKEDKEAVYRALVEACRERGGPATVGEVAAKARGVGSMQKIGQILRALWDDNRVDRGRDKERANVEVWSPK
jgi:predicted ArsR family transcriptional regulator